MSDYMQYWRYDMNAEGIAAGDDLDHTAGNQLGKVVPDDTVWIVTIKNGQLFLLGRVIAQHVVGPQKARKLLASDDLWEAKHHVIGLRRTVRPIRPVPIGPISRRLRFLGTVNKLPAPPSGRSFQALRRLTPSSADLLRRLWNKSDDTKSRDLANVQAAFAAQEGTLTEVRRYSRGRSRTLRLRALESARGRCEACQRDFSELLDGRGTRVLQVHHRKQLAVSHAPRVTHLRDLAVVCANCHSLLHHNPKKAMAVDALRRLLQADRM